MLIFYNLFLYAPGNLAKDKFAAYYWGDTESVRLQATGQILEDFDVQRQIILLFTIIVVVYKKYEVSHKTIEFLCR